METLKAHHYSQRMAKATAHRCASVLLASKRAIACRCARTSPNLVSTSRKHLQSRPKWRRRASSLQARTRLIKPNSLSSRTIGGSEEVFCRIRNHEKIYVSLGLLQQSSCIEELRRALASTSKQTLRHRRSLPFGRLLFQMLPMTYSCFRKQPCKIEHAMNTEVSSSPSSATKASITGSL